MISKEMYERILSDYQAVPFLQRNYYYSTGQRDKAARIRKINDIYLFTLKARQPDHRDEYEFEVSGNDPKDPRIVKLMNEFDIASLTYQGYMDTWRAIVQTENGELCIDRSEYNGQTDYELEYELHDPEYDTFSVFEKILARYGLTYRASSRSKCGRFLNAK